MNLGEHSTTSLTVKLDVQCLYKKHGRLAFYYTGTKFGFCINIDASFCMWKLIYRFLKTKMCGLSIDVLCGKL